jgi:hypothetical protein
MAEAVVTVPAPVETKNDHIGNLLVRIDEEGHYKISHKDDDHTSLDVLVEVRLASVAFDVVDRAEVRLDGCNVDEAFDCKQTGWLLECLKFAHDLAEHSNQVAAAGVKFLRERPDINMGIQVKSFLDVRKEQFEAPSSSKKHKLDA